MSSFRSTAHGPSRASHSTVIEEFRAEFSAEWRPGTPPRIEDYLVRVPGESQATLFRELLAVELAFRRSRGELPDSEDYSERYPQFFDEVSKLFETQEGEAPFDSRAGGSLSTESITPRVRTAPGESLAGHTVGRYRLDVWVGRGGFGEVWKGFDPELNRPVAIKLARRDRRFPDSLVNQLRDEARRAAKLSHRGIVTVHDVARDGDGLYIVSEYIDGQTLRFRMTSAPVSLDEAVSLVIQVARALHHAHVNDLVHRDVKPGNILLRPDGEAVVTDFGLAVSEREQLAEPEGTVGTWPYMSPEQARGESNQVDSRTDVYGLGVVLYELLTRRYPYPAETKQEYREQVISRPPRPLRTIDDSIPDELEQICLRCLAKSVDDRFSTCRDLADALSRWQDARDVVRSPSGATDAIVSGRRLILAFLGAALAIVVAVVAFKILPSPSGHGEDPPPPPGTWISVLDREPTMLSWRLGDGREPPRFEPQDERYAVRSDRTRWIARCRDIDSRPIELRAVISVDNWLGCGGIVWGLRRDAEAFPDKRYRCLAVEYFRTGPTEPAKLAALEMTLIERSFDDIRVTETRCIAELEVNPPADKEASLELSIDQDHINVQFDQQADWEPVDLLEMTDWLPDGRTAVGLTGQSRETAIRDFAFRYLPHIEEPSP